MRVELCPTKRSSGVHSTFPHCKVAFYEAVANICKIKRHVYISLLLLHSGHYVMKVKSGFREAARVSWKVYLHPNHLIDLCLSTLLYNSKICDPQWVLTAMKN
jgi:hypothetical protein